MLLFQIRQCTQDECRFRFPVSGECDQAVAPEFRCPRCGAPTSVAVAPYANYKEKLAATTPPGPVVEALLDNIRSTYNVGSMFRAADGAGLRRLHLCGMTPTPGNPKIVKTALGAEGAVAWEYSRNGLDTALSLKSQGMRVWALEGAAQAESLFRAVAELHPASIAIPRADPKIAPAAGLPVDAPILLVVGNELSGVDPGILSVCEKVVAIPMQGHKRSLNVAIAFGIAIYFLRFGWLVSDYNGSI